MQHEQKELPFDERFRKPEQYAMDLSDPEPRKTPTLEQGQTCGRLGYCYCPKCNPR